MKGDFDMVKVGALWLWACLSCKGSSRHATTHGKAWDGGIRHRCPVAIEVKAKGVQPLADEQAKAEPVGQPPEPGGGLER